MTPERARDLVHREGRSNPHMVRLARHLSIAAVVEVELIRAMRLRAMPNVDAGVEADLFFSDLVLARDVTSIVMYPVVQGALQEDLRLLKEELSTAREVIRFAHEGMDAAILLEEAVAYHALRDDAEGYAAMQRYLGTVVQALEGPDIDDDLLGWVDQILETLPDRALHSDAGKVLLRFFDGNLAQIRGGFTEKLTVGVSQGVEQIGFELRSEGMRLSTPPPTGWQSFALPGPLPVRVEIGYPVAGGWRTKEMMLDTPDQATEYLKIPFGLIRFRGDGGDEIRVRPEGPFHELLPRLLVLHASQVYSRREIIEDELQDLEWKSDSRPLRSNTSTMVFCSHSAKSGINKKRIDSLVKELKGAGLTPWTDSSRLRPGPDWNKKISQAIAECRAGIVLLDQEALASQWVRREFSSLHWRSQQDAGFNLHILRADDLDPKEILSIFGSQIEDFPMPEWGDGHRAVVEQLKAQLLPAGVPVQSCAAALMDFDRQEEFDRYISSLEPADDLHSGSDSGWDSHIDGAVKRSIPILIRVGERFGRVRYDRVLLLKGDDPDSFETRRRWVAEALKKIRLQGGGEPVARNENGESGLRSLLIAVEQQAIDDWRRAEYAKMRAATPTNPAHSMVMIGWDRWFSAAEQAPRSFNFYRSGRPQLAKLVGAGGTLWVVTSRIKEGGGKRIYQLAYCLRDAQAQPTTALDLRDKKPFRVGVGAPENITNFPIHDATDALFRLSFMAGKPSHRPGEIGSTLRRMIPHLTVGDVDLLDSLSGQLVKVGEDKVRLRRKITGDGADGHRGTVRSITVSADGAAALTAGNSSPDRAVKLWDLKLGDLLRTFDDEAAPGEWTAMAMETKPMGGKSESWKAVLGYGTELHLLDLASGVLLQKLPVSDSRILALAFIDATSVIAGTGSGELFRVDLKSGRRKKFPAKSTGEMLRIAVVNDVVVCLQSSLLQVFDLSGGTPKVRHRIETKLGSTMMHMQKPPLFLNSDASQVIFGSPLSRLHIGTGKQELLLDNEMPFMEATDTHAISATESSLTVWDVPARRILGTVRVEPEILSCVALSRQGRRMMAADYEHNLYVWDLPAVAAAKESSTS